MPDNILRPSTLNPSGSNNINQIAQNNANANAPPAQSLTPEMQVAIYNMVETAVRAAQRTDAPPEIENDVTIDAQYAQNIDEIDKIPDVVRYLKEFSGNANEFSSWKKSVDRILQIYEPRRGSPRYFGILNVIRKKIIGNADIVLESYNTPLNWSAISKCLTMHYADKRDISTLEYQLMSIVQGTDSVEEFYKKVYSHLSLILNKISCMDIDNNSISLLTKSYREKALDTFIRGLNGDLPRLLAIREPLDLPQALHLCSKLTNMNYRNSFTKNDRQNTTTPRKFTSMLVQQQYQEQYQQQQPQQHRQQPYQQQHQTRQQNQQQQQFFPQLAYVPQVQKQQQQNNYGQRQYNANFQKFPPPRPVAPKPHPYGEPMDIDQSIQTQRVNYINRPQIESQYKRPASGNVALQKRQRNYNINTEPEQQRYEYTNDTDNISEASQSEEQINELPLHDYTDVHFLG